MDQTRITTMAITKTVRTRRCSVTGKITRSCSTNLHGILDLDEAELINKIKNIVLQLCPDPDGKLYFKEFYALIIKDFQQNQFSKEQLKSVRKYIRDLLNNVIDDMNKEEEEDVVFVKEITVEERNKKGFENAIFIE